jgi:hypothetical protein
VLDRTRLRLVHYLCVKITPMKTSLLLCLVLISCVCFGQFDPNYKIKRTQTEESVSTPFNAGVGIGLSYGGLGGRLSYFPQKNVGLFGAVGFNFHKAGYNVGLIGRILPDKKVCPHVMAMYGYNAVFVVVGADEFNRTFYGPTIGGGMELRMGRNGNYMNFELLIPIRSAECREYQDFLLNNPTIEMSELLPVAISVGYHFKI